MAPGLTGASRSSSSSTGGGGGTFVFGEGIPAPEVDRPEMAFVSDVVEYVSVPLASFVTLT